MSVYLKLGAAASLPVIFSIIFYLSEKHTPFGKLNYWIKQTIYGVVFGCLAIFSTEFGIIVSDVTMNVRDAAPICAGLIFGAPAGIISGLIGGIERYFAALWGAGEYTRIACTIATIFSGLFSAWLRKYLFDDKKCSWSYGLATGIIAEVLHMLMVFLTNMDDARKAFYVVQKCAIPMILACGLSVMFATLAISFLGKEKVYKPKEKTNISQTFQRKLLICVLIAFFATSSFTYAVQDSVSDSEVQSLLSINLSDVKTDVFEASNNNLLSLTRVIATEVGSIKKPDSDDLKEIAKKLDITEINIIDENGFVSASTDANNIGFDMRYGKQSAEFLALLDGKTTEIVQEYQPIARDKSILRKYAGVALEQGGFVQVAYDSEDVHNDIAQQVVESVRNRHVGESGFMIICDSSFQILSDRENYSGQNLGVTGITTDDKHVGENTQFIANIYGENDYCMYTTAEGYYIIAAMPQSEARFSRDAALFISIFMEVLIFTALFILIYFLIKNQIVDNIRKINYSLAEITDGNLNVTVDVRSNEEFASLSDDINSTVSTLKHYIDEAAARIDKELEFAKTIQASSLPSVFPPYPNRKEFDIWAGMRTAKEVGGDFYDFYMLGDDKLAFLIADVSGKGIPAAMFMMTAKTMLKSLTETGADVGEVFARANSQLCENNEAGMFITSWMGILNLRTGIVTFANAGHNPPLIRRNGGQFEYLKTRAGFVLAGMDGIHYRKNELQLQPGDTLYLYTDGVTEATDTNEKLYGEQRLQDELNSINSSNAESICRTVKADVDKFVGDAAQFDDITMLCLTFNKPMEEKA